MTISVSILMFCYIILEIGLILLSYKLNSLLFTIHAILFKTPFLILFCIALYMQSPILVSYSIMVNFIFNFAQDLFFRKYHNSKISIPMLYVYIVLTIISIVLIVFDLYLYTLLLIPLCIILGLVINRDKMSLHR